MTTDDRSTRHRYRLAWTTGRDDDEDAKLAIEIAAAYLARLEWTPRGDDEVQVLDVVGVPVQDLSRFSRQEGRLRGFDESDRLVLHLVRAAGVTVRLHLDEEQRRAIEARLNGVPGDEALIRVEDWEQDRSSRGGHLIMGLLAFAFALGQVDDLVATLRHPAWSWSAAWSLVCAVVGVWLLWSHAREAVRSTRRAFRRWSARWRAERRPALER